MNPVLVGKRSRSSLEDPVSDTESGSFFPMASMLVSYLCSNLRYALLRLVDEDEVEGVIPDCDAYFLLILTKDFLKEIPTHLPLKKATGSDPTIDMSQKRRLSDVSSDTASNPTMSRYDAYMLVLEALDAFSSRCGKYRPIAVKCAALASELVKVQVPSRAQALHVLSVSVRSISSSIEAIQLASLSTASSSGDLRSAHFLEASSSCGSSTGALVALLFVPALSSLARALREVEAETETDSPSCTKTCVQSLTILIDLIATVSCCLNRILDISRNVEGVELSKAEALLQGLAEDDASLVSSLLHLLDVHSRLTSLMASTAQFRNTIDLTLFVDFLCLLRSLQLDPIGAFSWFVREALCSDVTVLLDLVTSNETDALLYLLRVLKFVGGAASDALIIQYHPKQPSTLNSFKTHEAKSPPCGMFDDSPQMLDKDDDPTVPFLLSFLRSFAERLGRMQRAGLLPFNAGPLASAAQRAIAKLADLSHK
jgi:hypothetical protein